MKYDRLEFQSVLTHPPCPAQRTWPCPLIIDFPTGATSLLGTLLVGPNGVRFREVPLYNRDGTPANIAM